MDTLGLLLNVVVHPADVQDRDGGLLVLRAVRKLFPFIERIFADGGYQGAATAAAVQALGPWQIEVVKRSDPHRFVVLPKRWIVTGCTELPDWVLNGRRRSSAIIYGPRAVRTPKPG